MPPRSPKKAKTPSPIRTFVSRGGGITEGLEMWRQGDTFILVDTTADNRFAADVETWNRAAV